MKLEGEEEKNHQCTEGYDEILSIFTSDANTSHRRIFIINLEVMWCDRKTNHQSLSMYGKEQVSISAYNLILCCTKENTDSNIKVNK